MGLDSRAWGWRSCKLPGLWHDCMLGNRRLHRPVPDRAIKMGRMRATKGMPEGMPARHAALDTPHIAILLGHPRLATARCLSRPLRSVATGLSYVSSCLDTSSFVVNVKALGSQTNMLVFLPCLPLHHTLPPPSTPRSATRGCDPRPTAQAAPRPAATSSTPSSTTSCSRWAKSQWAVWKEERGRPGPSACQNICQRVRTGRAQRVEDSLDSVALRQVWGRSLW